MRKLLFLLLACVGLAACDDIIFTDGRTVAQGYVTDSLAGQPVPGARKAREVAVAGDELSR